MNDTATDPRSGEADEAIDWLAGTHGFEAFESGEVIFERGETGSLLFYLALGEVRLERDGHAQRRVVAGETFGLEALHAAVTRPETARAARSCLVVPMSPERYRQLEPKLTARRRDDAL